MYLVQKALDFGAKKHDGQTRKFSGLPYIIHPVTVMYLITKFKGQSKNLEVLQCAAILHDVLEDTVCTYVELEREFGPFIASIVMELTSDKEEIERIGKNDYLKTKMIQMSNYALILKLIDRLANITDKPKLSYLEDTEELIKHLIDNRELSDRQFLICKEILSVCEKELFTHNKG